MDSSISISVVAPISNPDFISRVTGNIRSQTFKPKEVIVVLNGAAQLSEIDNRQFCEDVKWIVIRSTVASASAARNIGLKLSTGQWIALLDSDDIWMRDKLEKQAAFITLHPGQYVLSSRAIRISSQKIEIKPSVALSGNSLLSTLYKPFTFWTNVYVPTPSLLFPRSMVASVLFDETLDNREDLKFLLDLERNGCPIIQTEEPLVLVMHNRRRAIERETPHYYLRWCLVLCRYSVKASFSFATGVGIRNALAWLSFSLKAFLRARSQN